MQTRGYEVGPDERRVVIQRDTERTSIAVGSRRQYV